MRCFNFFRVVATALLLWLPWALWPGVALPHDQLVLDQDAIPQVIRWSPEHQGWRGASGVVVSPGVVLTARHVVGEGVTERRVVFAGRVLRTPTLWCVSPKGVDFAILVVEVPNQAHQDHPVRINAEVPQQGEIVTIAGYPDGAWATLVTQVMYETTDTPIRWQAGGAVLYPHIVWVSQPNQNIGRFGFSGGAVFDGEGALRGIICCASTMFGFLGFVPIKYGLASCPLVTR